MSSGQYILVYGEKTRQIGRTNRIFCPYPITAQCCPLYRIQSFQLYSKSNDWFLYVMQHWGEMECSDYRKSHFPMSFI